VKALSFGLLQFTKHEARDTPPMTEADLDTLLRKTAARLRLQRALRACLAALGAGLLLAAAMVLWSRLKNHDILLAAGLSIPPLLAVIALFAAYLRSHPPLEQVALLLDQRSGSAEHLVTWYEFRNKTDRVTTDLQREFLAAQRIATLAKAAGMDPRSLVPVRLPEWSRIVLLAFLLLCCAWLTPPPELTGAAATNDSHRHRTVAASPSGTPGDASVGSQEEIPTVEMLSQTDQQRMQLLASDPMLSEARKADAFKDLQSKLAGIPDSQLTALDRQLLNQLRPESAKTAKSDAGDSTDSANQSTSKTNDHNNDTQATPKNAAAIPRDPAKAFSSIRTQFPAEMQHRLESYYSRATANEVEHARNE
jgi:hypothetical protein